MAKSSTNGLVGSGFPEGFYLKTHSTHFIYGYMASDMVKDHSDRGILLPHIEDSGLNVKHLEIYFTSKIFKVYSEDFKLRFLEFAAIVKMLSSS